jgi:hypothetical protein
MTEIDVARLMTHDAVQAQAARALGFVVVIPGHAETLAKRATSSC